MKRKYVATSIEEFLNESKTLTLKRSYGGKAPVVVSAKAPIRNQVLSFVSECEGGKVSKKEIKRFIAGLNEGNKSPNAAANVWLKRNRKFFEIYESNGETFFKLSKIGKRLVNQIKPSVISESKIFEQKKEEAGDHDFVDTKKGYERKGIYDKANESEDEEEEKVDESKKDKRSIKEILEAIKAKKNKNKLNEEEEEEDKGGDDLEGGEEETGGEDLDFDDELSFDDLNLDGDDEGEGETDDLEGGEDEGDDLEGGEEGDELEGDDVEGGEEDERVEIVEFTIQVDNVDEAIAELEEKGVSAEPVEGEEGKISVSADDWETLKEWLEDKGVDIVEMFGGEIEVEGGEEEMEGGEEGEGDDLEGEEFSFSLDGEGEESEGEEEEEEGEEKEEEGEEKEEEGEEEEEEGEEKE